MRLQRSDVTESDRRQITEIAAKLPSVSEGAASDGYIQYDTAAFVFRNSNEAVAAEILHNLRLRIPPLERLRDSALLVLANAIVDELNEKLLETMYGDFTPRIVRHARENPQAGVFF